MRRVGLTDLDLAARVLLGLPPEHRAAMAMGMLVAAHNADKIRKRLNRAMSGHGDGSLATQALLSGLRGSGSGDPDYFDCLSILIEAIRGWRQDRNTRHPDP